MRCTFYAHSAAARASWPQSAGKGLEVQLFGVGGIAKDRAVAFFYERLLCMERELARIQEELQLG